MKAKPTPHRTKKGKARWPWVLAMVGGTFVALIVIAVFAASPIATALANRKMSRMAQYDGRVKSIVFQVWQGNVVAKDFTLVARSHAADGPVLRIGTATLSLSWSLLVRGTFGGDCLVDGAEILIAPEGPAAPADNHQEQKENKKEAREAKATFWVTTLRDGFPLELTRLEATNLKVRFKDENRENHPAISLEKTHLVVTDFGRSTLPGRPPPAKLSIDATLPSGGNFKLLVSADPEAAEPHFKATMQIRDLALPPLHDLMASYAKVDISAGTFELFAEMSAQEGHYKGYLKPFFRDLKFKPVPDPEKNVAQRLVTQVASSVTSLLKNHEGKIATKAPFQGDFADNNLDLWSTVGSLLRNAFIQSLHEGLEGQKATG